VKRVEPAGWFDRQGMASWCRGVARLIEGRVAIRDHEGRIVLEEGSGGGAVRVLPFRVNGEPAGSVEVAVGSSSTFGESVLEQALETLERLADLRNSLSDLVRTTAHQWRELSLLYKFTDALSGALDPAVLARHLTDRAHSALRGWATAVCFRTGEAGERMDCRSVGEGSEMAEPVASWGMELETGAIYRGMEELDAGGSPPSGEAGGVMVVPIRARASNYGVLAVLRPKGESFTAEDLKLGNLLAHQTALAFANLELIAQVRRSERIRRELEMAAEIQASILPPPLIEAGPLKVVSSCVPAQEVGGDAYIVLPLDDGLLAGVADVSGHGLSSALLMNAFASEIQALCLTETRPGALLDATNRLIGMRVGDMSLFVTVVLVRYWEDGKVSIASAGHPPAMVLTAGGGVELIDIGGVPLGVLDDERYEEAVLEPGSYNGIVLYSDGLTEARNVAGAMYGLGRLEELLRRLAEGRPGSAEVHAAILEDLRRFTGGVPQADDLTVLSVGIGP